MEVMYNMSDPADRDAYTIASNAQAVCQTLQTIGDQLCEMWQHEDTARMTGDEALRKVYAIYADAHSAATRQAMEAWG